MKRLLMLPLLVTLTSSANAQTPADGYEREPASTFDQLRLTLRLGDKVVVTHEDGRRSRGRVEGVSEHALTVRPTSRFRFRKPGPKRDYVASDVVQVTRIDPLGRGVGIGLAAGFGLATIPCWRGDSEEGTCVLSMVLVGPSLALVGMGVGGVIDALIRETVFRRVSAASTVSVSPVFRRGSTGVSLSMRF